MERHKGSFTTSFGTTIPFAPGHLEFVKNTTGIPVNIEPDLKDANINAARGHEHLDYAKINRELGSRQASLSLNGYAARFSRVYTFLELARNTNITFPFRKSLDIGCGFAIQPRIMRGLGLVREAVGIDVYDRTSGIDEQKLMRQHRQLHRFKWSNTARRLLNKLPHQKNARWHRAIVSRIRDPINAAKEYNGWMHDSDFYRQKVVGPFTLDRYINGDIFTLQETFDCITSFSSLEWFEAKPALKKIAELLEVGGVFELWVPNWWHAVNTTTLAGHFPFACQRLTKEDFFRYLDESFPEENVRAMKVWYEYFDPSHPTLSQYIEYGHEYGLVPLAHHAHINASPISAKYGITSLGYFQNDHAVINEVMADIHRFRPDVRKEDLLPRTHSIIFQKVDTARRLDRQAIDDAYRRLRPR